MVALYPQAFLGARVVGAVERAKTDHLNSGKSRGVGREGVCVRGYSHQAHAPVPLRLPWVAPELGEHSWRGWLQDSRPSQALNQFLFLLRRKPTPPSDSAPWPQLVIIIVTHASNSCPVSSLDLGQISPSPDWGVVGRANVSPISQGGDGSQVSSGGFAHVQLSPLSSLSPSLLRSPNIPSHQVSQLWARIPGGPGPLPCPLAFSAPAPPPPHFRPYGSGQRGIAPSCGLQEKRISFPSPTLSMRSLNKYLLRASH